MSLKIKSNYPIFIPTKGRADNCKTAGLLGQWDIPFILVVEQEDWKPYKSVYPDANYLLLEKSNQGLAYARNQIKSFAMLLKYKYHWQLDDDIKNIRRRQGGKNEKINPLDGFLEVEEIVNRFSNVAVAGLRDSVFAWTQTSQVSLNKQISSAVLINNNNDLKWSADIIEDTDYCIQSLLSGDCTILFNQVLYEKAPNNVAKGGLKDASLEEYNQLKHNLVKKYPNFFKLVKDKKGRDKIAPSRIWQSFNQKLAEV